MTTNVRVDFATFDDPESNYNAKLSFTNDGEYFKGWTIEFDAPFEITGILDGEILSREGDRYVIEAVSSSDDISAGETTDILLDIATDDDAAELSNIVFNGEPVTEPEPDVSSVGELSDDAIFRGFENHDAGTAYTRDVQEQDWTVSFQNDTDRFATVTDAEAKSGDKSLQVRYPDNESAGLGSAFELPERDEYYLKYSVKFADDFDFDGPVYSGGKLPGLAATGWASGGEDVTGENGFSARYMWREDGEAELYLYHMDKPGRWGDSIKFEDANGDNIAFERGQWHDLVQRVEINDGTAANGEIDVWMDGEQVLDLDGLRFTTNGQGVDSLMLSSFFGGSDWRFWPDNEVEAYFDDFIISPHAEDVGLAPSDDGGEQASLTIDTGADDAWVM